MGKMAGIIRYTVVFLLSMYTFGASLAQTTTPTRPSNVAFSVV